MSPTSTSSVIDEETVRLVNNAREEHNRERENRRATDDDDDGRHWGVATVGGGAVAVLPNQVTPDLTYLSPLNIRFNDEDEDFFLEPGAFDVWMPHALLNVQVNAATPNAEVPYADNDVLFGQGGLVNTHPGNRRFRSLAGEFRQPYITTSSREEKRQLVQRFVANVRANGARFWDKDENGTYVEVDVDNKFYSNKFQQLIRADPVVEREKAIQRAENRRARQRAR